MHIEDGKYPHRAIVPSILGDIFVTGIIAVNNETISEGGVIETFTEFQLEGHPTLGFDSFSDVEVHKITEPFVVLQFLEELLIEDFKQEL